MGAALALAETLVKMDKDLATTFTGELHAGATDSHWPVRTTSSFGDFGCGKDGKVSCEFMGLNDIVIWIVIWII